MSIYRAFVDGQFFDQREKDSEVQSIPANYKQLCDLQEKLMRKFNTSFARAEDKPKHLKGLRRG